MRMGATEWLLLATLSVLWGGSFFFGKVALGELPPITLVLLRVGLAALALHALVRVRGVQLPTDRAHWRDFFVMGLLNNLLPFGLLFWGQTQIASGLAAILNATTPLFTVVLAHLLTRDERLTPLRLGGVLLGLAGVVVMVGPDALAGLSASLLAQVACLGAAVSYGLAGIFGRRFRDDDPAATAAGQVTATTVMALPLALLVDRPWVLSPPSAATLGAVLGLALLSTALAYVVYFRILAAAGATNLVLVTFLIPVSAILLGTGILGERLDGRHVGGMVLIAAGLAAIDGRLVRAIRRRPDEGGPVQSADEPVRRSPTA